jgi:DMSO/TMAO reductase YedYZ molybdopterin-dependent catalytic subunit
MKKGAISHEPYFARFPQSPRRPSRGGGTGAACQYVTRDFPVLSAGPTPHTPLGDWTFSIRQDGKELRSWSWQEIRALPAETVTVDIHCVTKWSKLDTQWRGVRMDTLLDAVEHA